MAVSSSSMKVASVTVTAMIQGLITGRVAARLGTEMEAAAALIGVPGCLDATRDRSVSSNVWYNAISDQLVAELVLRDLMRKGEQTRQEIIRKAAPIFNQRGYDGAALSDLMKATGPEKGGIYRHFGSKQQLAAEAFDYAWRETLG